MDKKSKKAFEAAVLEELGAKKAKGPRVSAKIGLGEMCAVEIVGNARFYAPTDTPVSAHTS